MLHQTDEQLELYTLGRLPEPAVAALEEHLLICEGCRKRLDETEAFALSMRAAIAREPAESPGTGWLEWFHLGALRFAELRKFAPLYAGGFAAILLLAAFYVHSRGSAPPVASIALTAMRGDMLSVKAARETDIILTDAPAGSDIPAEVVDAAGGMIWRGVLPGNTHKLQVLKQLAPGSYFVRIYDDTGKLLHEYGFRVL
jgi:hypothetical protein